MKIDKCEKISVKSVPQENIYHTHKSSESGTGLWANTRKSL